MRPLAVALAVAGLGLAVATALIARTNLVEPPKPVAVPAANEDVPRPVKPAPVRPPVRVRPVAPDVVAAPPIAVETLERVDPREPLSPIGRAISPADGPPKETVLFRPLVSEAGVFHALGHSVALAGLEPTAADEICASDGIEWPCGIHARTAFRNFLRGRAPSCVVPAVPGDEVIVADCRLGGVNPAEWLVSQGWARAVPSGPYAAMETEARREGRGLFGHAPSVSQ